MEAKDINLENKIIIDQETGEVISLKDYEPEKAKENTNELDNQKVV